MLLIKSVLQEVNAGLLFRLFSPFFKPSRLCLVDRILPHALVAAVLPNQRVEQDLLGIVVPLQNQDVTDILYRFTHRRLSIRSLDLFNTDASIPKNEVLLL